MFMLPWAIRSPDDEFRNDFRDDFRSDFRNDICTHKVNYMTSVITIYLGPRWRPMFMDR